jgi:hypothetical protein
MGWWKDPNGFVIGDVPLDLAEEFFVRVTREYVSAHGRKPTLPEILGTLGAILRHRADEFVDVPETVSIDAILAKTKRRPSKQPIHPGDVFTIPLANGALSFGRVTPQVSYFEFFEVIANQTVAVGSLRDVPRFTFPALVMLDPLLEWRWRVIGHIPFDDGEFTTQPFRIGGQIECGKKVVKGFVDPSSELRLATPDEMRGVPPHDLWTAKKVERELELRLAKLAIRSSLH